MKNVIKRGTSLLLVLAILLSFAVVVGAEEPEKYLTLTAGSIVLHAGESKCLPVYEAVKEGYGVDSIALSANSSDKNNVVVDGLYQGIPTEWTGKKWKFESGIYTVLTDPDLDIDGEVTPVPPKGTPLLVWTSSTDSFKTSDLPLCYVKVTAPENATPGVYQINLTSDPNVEEKSMFTVAPPEGGPSQAKTTDDAILNPGTVVVIPATASLPTVIMTDDTFAVPTWAQMKAGEDIYPLASRMKIVGTDGKLYAVDPTTLTVEKDSAPTGVSVKNNQLEILTSTLRNDDTLTGTGTLRVTNAKAVDADISVTSATVSFKVNRAPAVATHVGFGKNHGYVPVPADAKPLEASSDAAKDVQFELSYGYPGVFDQYGYEISGATANIELKLYSDAFQTELSTSDEVLTANQVTMGQTKLLIKKELKKDVWCEIKTSWTNSDGSKTITGDTVKVHITSNYPQPKKAIISLTDESGATASNTIEIPAIGAPDKTITYAVTSFLDQNGTPMDKDTTPKSYTVTPYMKGTGTSPVSGVTDKDSTITVTSAAVSDSPITVTFTVKVEGKSIPNYLTAEAAEAETPTATLTIKKADPIASSLASMENGTGDYKKDKIFPASGSAFPTVLPGIGEEKTVELVPLYVLDQYSAVMQTGVAAANYKLYKVDGETKTLISADYAKFEDGSEGRVTLKLTNALAGEEGAKSLALTAGNYQIEATYNNKTATASFAMAEATEKTYVATVTAEITTYGYTGDKSVKTLPVPYAHGGTSQQRQTPEITYTATVTDQYGKAPADGTNVVAKITSIKLGTSQADYINDNSSKFIVINGTTNAAKLQVTKELATVMNLDAADSVVVHVGLTVTVDGKPATVESVPDYTFTTDEPKLGRLGVYLRTDENTSSALGSWSSDATNNPEALTVVAPAGEGTTRNVLDFAVYDQYRRSNGFAKALTKGWLVKGELPTGMTFGNKSLTAGSIYEVTVTKDAVGKTFTITAPAAKNVAGTDWTVKVTAVAVEFVKTVDGKNDTFQLSDYLTNDTFSAEYNGQPWSTILTTKPDTKVYIKTAEGNNTLIDEENLSLEVTKDGAPVGMDAKANAGSYQVKLVYTDTEGQKYTVDEKTFTISPKTVKITVNGAITKEYDGTQNLVLPASVTLTIEGNPADLTVDPSALQYASENAGTDIRIELMPGETTCLTGAAAANYNVYLSELKGTIAKRVVLVTPEEKTFTYGANEQIEAALKNAYTLSAKTDTLPTDTAKQPKFTDDSVLVLTENGAAVSKNSDGSYNAGTYEISIEKLKLTDASAQNYEFKLKTTTEKPSYTWTISKKSVDPFNVTLEADFGVYGSELYTKMADQVVTVDGKSLKISDLYNVGDLEITGVSRTGTDLVNAGEYTVTSLPATTLGSANYEFKTAPTLKINVKPHVLTDANVQLSGETSAGFDGTKKTVTVTVSFKYGDRTVSLTKDTDYTVTGEVEAANAGGHFLTVTAVPNGNLTGSVQKRWQIWSYEIQPGDLTFKLKSGVTFTYDTTPKKLQKSDVTWDVTATDAKRKAFLKKYFTEDDFNLDCLARTDAGDYTASASMRHNFTKSKTSGAFNMNVSWTIGKSSEKPISDQTASTKYGQPGSTEITVSDGVKKGLDTSKLSVSIVRDTDKIISGTPTAKVENGKITVNWQLQGDATTIDKSAKLRVTVAETDNYKPYTFDVVVTATKKLPQTGFGFTTATNVSVGYAEDTYTNPVQNAKTIPVYMSSNESVATVDNNGVVTIKDVGENVTITATAPENGEYASATASYTLTVVPSTLTVTASSATMTANGPVPSFTASVTGLKRGQTTAQVFQTLTASAATDGKTAGTYAVNASATLKTDFVPRYTLRFVPGTLTVNPAVSVIDTILPTIIAGNGCANGYANCACESFYDLDASRWYHEAIDWAYSLGLMNGTTKSTFGPNAAATRAQTWTMLARIAGQDTRRSSTWYEVGQKWAMNLGITDGTNPMGSLTREQLAAMLYRYVGSPAVNGTLTFTDSANVSTWARNAMIWAVQNGILDGVGGNRLNPKGTTTRAQAAAIFMRFSKLINK